MNKSQGKYWDLMHKAIKEEQRMIKRWYEPIDSDDAWIAKQVQDYEQQQWEELEQAKQLSLPLGYVTQPTNKGESL